MKHFRFTHAQRLHGKTTFTAVYQQGQRRSSGPLLVVATPNELSHNRMGLSVSRKVGNSVKRHRIKRMLREAFRLSQHDQPTGYDLIVIVRPHEDLSLSVYQQHLTEAIEKLHRRWENIRQQDA